MNVTDRQLEALLEVAEARSSWDLLPERVALTAAGLLVESGPRYKLTKAGHAVLNPSPGAARRRSEGERGSGRLTMDTLTWRALIAGKVTRAVKVPRGDQPAPCRRGDTLPVMRHTGGRAVCRVHVLERPQLSLLGDLVPAGDVRAALDHGAPTSTEFQRRFLALHDQRVRRLDADAVSDLTAAELIGYFERWLERPVWSLRVTLDREQQDRFLARSSRATGHQLVDAAGFPLKQRADDDNARGYTHDPRLAVEEEGAAVDDATLAVFTDDARARDAARAREATAELRAALGRLEQLAGEQGVQVGKDRRVIEDRIARLERKLAA